MSVAVLDKGSQDQIRARFDLSVSQANLDGIRILSLLRTRRYQLQRFELEPPSRCHLWVRLPAAEVALLTARLERLAGVSVEGGNTWIH